MTEHNNTNMYMHMYVADTHPVPVVSSLNWMHCRGSLPWWFCMQPTGTYVHVQYPQTRLCLNGQGSGTKRETLPAHMHYFYQIRGNLYTSVITNTNAHVWLNCSPKHIMYIVHVCMPVCEYHEKLVHAPSRFSLHAPPLPRESGEIHVWHARIHV